MADESPAVLRILGAGYVLVLLCALTLGPVTYMWSRVLSVQADVHTAVDVTFVLLQIPALVLLVRRMAFEALRPLWPLGALVAWLALSTFWSVFPSYTRSQSIGLILTCGVGVYLVVTYSWEEIVLLVFLAMQPGLVLSWIAIWRSWPGTETSLTIGAEGIYGNRNSLGPPAVIGAACGIVLLALLLRGGRDHAMRAVVGVVVFGVVLFDLSLQRRSESLTSWIMLASFVGVIVVVALVQLGSAARLRPDLGVICAFVMVGIATLGFVLAAALNDQVSRALGRPPGFHRRTDFWKADLAGFRDRPIVGWGWMAAWRADGFRSTLSSAVTMSYSSHSAYFDLALGGGVVALGLAALWGLMGVRSAGRVLRPGHVATFVPIALAVAIGLACTEESFFVGDYFLTALLVAALSANVHGLHQRQALRVEFRHARVSPCPEGSAAVGDCDLRPAPRETVPE